MITYAIEALFESKLFSNIYVSTDDEEIARISSESGAEVPFSRPSSLGGDEIGTVPVIADFLQKLGAPENQIVCCAYATNPFLNAINLRRGIQLIESDENPDYSCALTKYNYPIQRSLLLENSGLFKMANPENLLRHSQTLVEHWHDAGQFYFAKASTWIDQKPMLINTAGVILNKWEVVDIDDAEDWERAEILFELLKLKKV
jgi:N-acylneuraminate cytidylyltransferase